MTSLWTFVNAVFLTVRMWLRVKQVRTEKDPEMPADFEEVY